MLKNRFILFLVVSSILFLILNFSLLFIFLNGDEQIRLMSFAFIFSFVEIIAITLFSRILFKSTNNFAKDADIFSKALNFFEDGIIIYDENFRVLFLNKSAEKLFGITHKNVFGITLNPEYALRDPVFKSLIGVIFFSKFEIEGTNFLVKEFDLKKESGKEIHLKVVKKEYVQKENSEMKEFVAIVAHQLRTPLSGIKWILKMLLQGDAGILSNIQMDLIKKGYSTNEKLIKLVNDLLDVSRLEDERFFYNFKRTDLLSILKMTVSDFHKILEEKNIKLIFEKTPDAISEISVDAEKISMVLSNLIFNAIKYTKLGGEIKINLGKKNNFAEISIIDNGVGIPESEQPKIFSKFFRASNAARVDSEGTGLGLYLCSKIIKDHGGNIYFKSKENIGSAFYFTLPLNRM